MGLENLPSGGSDAGFVDAWVSEPHEMLSRILRDKAYVYFHCVSKRYSWPSKC